MGYSKINNKWLYFQSMKAPAEKLTRKDLDERTVDRNPIRQFKDWYADALGLNEPFADAMALATATSEGKPAVRIVLLKDVDEKGFVFYTNYSSRKGGEVAGNPFGALLFFWRELHRQVRIEGGLSAVSPEESDAYFASRPRESQIGALASPQSKVIPDRDTLERAFQDIDRRYRDAPVPRPPHWGGFRLAPSRIEFWQGRDARLHDRIEYLLEQNGSWLIRRLAP
jgi:pyridoxamine 5'-phosphate oxidase